ncbi:MAG: rhomboid family intramembrane serine protease [Bacteroidota bacterium]
MSVFGSEINRFIKSKSILNRLMLINIGLFLVISILAVIGYLSGIGKIEKLIVYNLAVPASLSELLYKPWTLFTYMFLQEDFFHVLFNMIMLYFGGKLFSDLLGERRLLAVYILGGLAGAVLYIVSFNVFPAFQNTINSSIALGASASVLAVFVAVAAYMPDMQVTLFLFGNIKLKWVALIMVVLDFINIKNGNSGGHIAHIGGAIFGLIYTLSLQKGTDLSKGINKLFEGITSLFKPKPKMKVAYKKTKSDAEFNTNKKAKQQQVDAILDKISKSGYDSLTKEEKDILFKISKENF